MTPTTPNKTDGNGSPGKFIRPADLFKMRRNSSKTITLTPNNNSNSSNPGANISFHLHSSPIGGFNQPKLPVPSSPNFKRISAAHHVEPPSPLKCLSNLADPSPTKNLPNILKNPFDKPVKRKLMLSPKKAIKRSKMIEMDEDANLEPPKTQPIASPIKGRKCLASDWTLKTKLKVRFDNYCKNWNESANTTHRRFQETATDSSISLEAIKNLATVYQQPYLAWLPLYPRTVGFYKRDTPSLVNFTKSPQITKSLLNDWCESLDDLSNLMIEGKCPYFYLCSDNYNILFKQKTSSSPVQAFVSPFTFGMATELNKLRIDYKYPKAELADLRAMPKTASSSSLTNPNRLDNSSSQDRVAPSIDSGHCSDLSDDEDGANGDEDTSQILETMGLTDKDLPSLVSRPKGFVAEADSNTQSSSQVPLATIEGVDNIKKFIKFLQTNRLYTLTNLGRYAHIPPTLLSPCQFRLSTPQVPEVQLSRNVMERNKSPSKNGFRLKAKQPPAGSKSISVTGPASIEITGTILPNLYKELHNLLVLSDNEDHTCQSTTLESSAPLSTIQF